MNQNVAAIIVAAGSSRRMRSVCEDKLLLKIGGIPVLARTLLNYQKAKTINHIYVVTRPELFETVTQFAKQYNIDKFVCCAVGGESRQLSVQNGLALCEKADLVAIGDGARPFTKPEHIDKVTRTAAEHGGALLGVPAKDTIKRLTSDGFVEDTPPRALLLNAQTPQTFQKAVFEKLLNRAVAERKQVTDDSSVFELYGHKVMPIIGDYDNIKITTEEDIATAEAIAGKESL